MSDASGGCQHVPHQNPEAARQRRPPIVGRILIGGICFVLTVEYFVAQWIAQSAWPGYRARDLDVSALGVTTCGAFVDPQSGQSLGYVCSPMHLVMNIGFIVLGTLILGGVTFSWQAWPKRRLTTAGLLLLAASGIGEILSGSAPGNVNIVVHATGALLHWVAGSTAMIFLGIALWRVHSAAAIASVFSGTVALIGVFLYGSGIHAGLGRGGMQRMASFPLTIWLVVTGVSLIVWRSSSK